MTTTVKKGAGRPAATAKSNKHAQRTPLPPKAGSAGAKAILDAKIEAYGKKHHLSPEAIEAMKQAARDVKAETVEQAAQAWTDLGDGGDETTAPGPLDPKPVGKMTVVELKARAKALGVEGYSRMAKGALMNAILEAEKAQTTTAERLAGRDLAAEVFEVAEKSATPASRAADEIGEEATRKPAKRAKAKREEAPAPAAGPAGLIVPLTDEETMRSVGKAEAFIKAAADLGWLYANGESAAEVYRTTPGIFGVTVARGEERISIEWKGGVFEGDTCYYSHPARTPIKLRNASHAKKVMAIAASEADATARKVSAHKAARPGRKSAGEATTERRKALPFSETSLDQEVLDALYGKTITWTNAISGKTDEDRVPRPAEPIRNQDGTPGRRKTTPPVIVETPKGRVINFLSALGMRSVRLSSIVAVR